MVLYPTAPTKVLLSIDGNQIVVPSSYPERILRSQVYACTYFSGVKSE